MGPDRIQQIQGQEQRQITHLENRKRESETQIAMNENENEKLERKKTIFSRYG